MISITPMSKEKMARFPRITKPLDNPQNSGYESSLGSVLSQDIFAPKMESSEYEVTEVAYSRMAVIPLEIPMPNPFLLTKTNVWSTALGLSQMKIRGIANGTYVVKKETLELIDTKYTATPYREKGEAQYYIGGEALLALLDNACRDDNPDNIEKRYQRLIAARYIPESIIPPGYEDNLEELITKNKTSIHLFADYYLDVDKFPPNVKELKSFSYTSAGLTISDHSGDLLYNTDKLRFEYGDATTDALEEYGFNGDNFDNEFDYEEDYYDDEEVDSTLASLADELYEDLDKESYEDEEEEMPLQDFKEDDEDISFETYKGDSKKAHQYDKLNIYRVITTEEGLARLRNSIMWFVPVLPAGFRKAFEGTADYKTVIYDRIVRKTHDLAATMGNPNLPIDEISEAYKFIYNLVVLLFLGDDKFARKLRIDPKKYKSINGDLKSKHGLIRATLEGGRFDYSARTVIVSSPTMRIDCCGIPLEIVGAIFRPFLAKRFVDSLIQEGDNPDLKLDIPEYINRNYKQYLGWVRRNAGKLNLYAYIGRQPTLHYLSTQPYRVIPVDGNALIVSPLVVVPFNADFDGDQMHIEACLTAAAHKEIQENTLLNQQPKRKPNGTIEAAPRLEMVYGLYLTYFGTESIGVKGEAYSSSTVQLRLRSAGDVPPSTGVNDLALEALQKGIIGPSDTIDGVVAGRAALCSLLFDMSTGIDEERLKKSIVGEKKGKAILNAKGFTKTICDEYQNVDKKKVPHKLTDVVVLGNGVANRFPPRLTLDAPKEMTRLIQEEVTKFNKDMFEKKDMVNLGLQSLDAYDSIYSENWNKLAKKVDDLVAEYLPIDNGFALMVATGAKGDSGTLRQLFGVKGVIQQVLDRPFNCVLGHSYAQSLPGLEHFCTSYGSRKGLTDKVLATSKPGYLSRKLEHAGATQSIVVEDCGTTEGIEMTILDINNMLNDANPLLGWEFWDKEAYAAASKDKRYKTIYKSAKSYMAEKIYRRNVVLTADMFDGVRKHCPEISLPADDIFGFKTVYVKDTDLAARLVDACWGKDFPTTRPNSSKGSIKYKPIIMRSPITCKCPVCQTCFGYDPTTDTDVPEIGKQVGFIAAQAISEPGTQMTMKNFQKGGVAGSANLTSSFDVICAYFDMMGRNKSGKILYDYVAPVASVVSEKINTDGSKVLVLKTITDLEQAADCIRRGAYEEIRTSGTTLRKTITFPRGITFKKVVQAGESVILGQKYLDPKQLMEARGCASVLKYLMLLMTDIYRESGVNSVYVETILSGMILGKLLEDITVRVDGRDVVYPAGTMISRQLLWQAGRDISETVRVNWIPIGIKQLPKFKPDSMEAVIMESMSSYLPKSAILQPIDTCTNPILRVALNQGIYKKRR